MQHHQHPNTHETALLFIDLDHFKLINDNLNHQTDDHMLIKVTEHLRHCLHPKNHLARFDDDEFVTLLDDLACMDDAERITQHMLNNLTYHYDCRSRHCRSTPA